MKQRDQAICLRTVDYSETSQVLHFLTHRNGLVKLIAKGSKRSKSATGGAVDLLSEGDVVFVDKSTGVLGTLVEFSETASHTALRGSTATLNACLYMIELAEATVAEGDPHPKVFDLLHNGLNRLGQADVPVEAVLAYYQWRLLRHIGLLGELKRCVSCGRELLPVRASVEKEIYFTSSRGGLLCGACESAETEKFRVEAAALAALAALAAAEAGKKIFLPPSQAKAVSRLLSHHITEQLGKRLKMEQHVIV